MKIATMSYNSSSHVGELEHFYFAFGSNLHLDQMRRRCPQSRYIGTAKLHNYRFQINTRGFGNVLPSSGSSVEGLVYLLSAADEATLDIYEGVSTRFYDKQFLPVEIYTASINHVGRLVSELVPQLKSKHFSSTLDPNRPVRGEPAKALVYVDTQDEKDGLPKDEYIARMNAGIVDARKLGISDSYIDNVLRRYIPEQVLLTEDLPPVRKHRFGNGINHAAMVSLFFYFLTTYTNLPCDKGHMM